MAPVTITLEHNPAAIRELKKRIRGMRERSEDLSPAWEALLDWFADQNTQQFLTRGARYRDPWPPLAAATIAEKERLGYPLDPLVRTGRLRESLTRRPLAVELITPSRVSAGTDVDYAKHHQYGAPRANLPRRALFVPGQIRAEQAATSAVANYIIRGEQRVGGRTVMRGQR